jgi:hypothetical protein
MFLAPKVIKVTLVPPELLARRAHKVFRASEAFRAFRGNKVCGVNAASEGFKVKKAMLAIR